MRTGRQHRAEGGVVRALLVASSVVYLSLAGHLLAGGGVPGPGPLAVLLALSGALVLGLARQRLSFAGTFGVLVVGEVAFHVVLAVSAVTAHGAHGHASSVLPSPAMSGGHLLAALAAAFVIRFADSVIEAWRRFLASGLGGRFAVVGIVGWCRPTVVPAVAGGSPTSWTHHDDSRRGPPSSR